MSPRPVAPQPAQPQGPRPIHPQPLVPRPMAAPQPQAPRPMLQNPAQPPINDNKGLHIGAAISGFFQGGASGASNAIQNAEELDVMIPAAEYKLRDAGKRLAKLIKEYKEKFTYEDQTKIEKLIAGLKKAIEDKNLSSIKKFLNDVDKGFYEVETNLNAPHRDSDNVDDARAQQKPKVHTADLHNINEDELAIVRNKAIWGIQPGQIARRITERELDTAENLKGFIIQQGCSAMIFVNGSLIDTFEAGAYDVPQVNEQRLKDEYEKLFAEIEKTYDEQIQKDKETGRQRIQNATIAERGGLVGIGLGAIKRGFQFVFGATPKAKQEFKNRDEERLKKLKAETEKLLKQKNPEPLLSIIVVSNRVLTLTFGGIVSNEEITYTPYKVPTRLFDLEVGVSLQMKVTDVGVFATNYLTDQNSFSTIGLFNLINSPIENMVVQSLRNIDYESDGLSVDTQNNLKKQILDTINNQVFGMVCTQVMQITDRSEDFDRFRQVSRELYCSEKELDFLQRTGEMKNRLEIETNYQAIRSAENAEELRHALLQINKDQLLHEDELEEFVQMLDSQKRIRKAKVDTEEYNAIQDILKTRLVKEDEMAELRDALLHNTINREEITDIMRIQSHRHVENERLLAEWALDDMKTDHDWEREDLARRRSYGIEDEERERSWSVEDQELTRRLNHLREQDVYDDNRDEYKYNRDFSRRQQLDNYLFQQQQRQRDTDWQQHQREEQERRENEETAYNRTRQDKFDDADILNRNADSAVERLMKIQESERATMAQQQQHNENIHAMDVDVEKTRINAQATMSADQLAAQQMANLDSAAQSELAKAMGSGDKVKSEMLAQQNDQMKEMYLQMLNMQQQNQQGQQQSAYQTQQQMMQMMQMMMGGMTQMSTNQAVVMNGQFQQQQQYQQQRIEDQMQMKQEYRENMMHQQDRMDHTQDAALGNIGQVSTAAASNLGAFNCGAASQLDKQQFQQSNQEQTPKDEQLFECPFCGQPIHAWETPCSHCKNEIQWQ